MFFDSRDKVYFLFALRCSMFFRDSGPHALQLFVPKSEQLLQKKWCNRLCTRVFFLRPTIETSKYKVSWQYLKVTFLSDLLLELSELSPALSSTHLVPRACLHQCSELFAGTVCAGIQVSSDWARTKENEPEVSAIHDGPAHKNNNAYQRVPAAAACLACPCQALRGHSQFSICCARYFHRKFV